MDFLNKAFAQLSELFQSMTPGARITAGLLLAVVVISLGYLFTAQVSGPDTDLMNGVAIPPTYWPLMAAAFDKADLKNHEFRGNQIFVPHGKKSAYMAALADAKALPPNIDKVFDEALENTSPFMSKQEREQRLKVAKEKKLGLIVSLMDGIETAYVMYDKQEKSGFKRETITTATASAKATGSEHLDAVQVSGIRHVVASAIAGLKPESVTVADLNGRQVYYGSDADVGGGGHDNVYVALKRVHEQDWKDKILGALGYIRGIKVTTNVELDPQRINRSTAVKYDPKPTAVSEKDESSTLIREGTGIAGRIGFNAQQPNTATSLAGSRTTGNKEDEESTKREVFSLANTEHTELEKIGLTPTRVTVSVGIPNTYLADIWNKKNPTEEGQDPQTPDDKALETIRQEVETTIKDTAVTLIPLPVDGTEPTDLVTVSVFEDIQLAEIPGPGFSENAVNWFGEYWSTLGMIGLAMFSLVMLRSMVRAIPAGMEARPSSGGPAVHGEESDEDSAEEAALKRLGRFSGSGPSLRDELSDLVQEDPDAAANILRTWIGSVG